MLMGTHAGREGALLANSQNQNILQHECMPDENFKGTFQELSDIYWQVILRG